MKTSDFSFNLPPELIAQAPLARREDSRLLVLERNSGKIRHHKFRDILTYLTPKDCLVANETKVIPARLKGKKTTGAGVEFLLIKQAEKDLWEVLCRPARRLLKGSKVALGEGQLTAEIIEVLPWGKRLVKFSPPESVAQLINEIGEIPLPPYIHQPLPDKARYQTVYAREEGSIAAPTAGLHFSKDLLKEVEKKGIKIAWLTLDISLDTFRPITAENVEEHQIHSEEFLLPPSSASLINETIAQKGRIVAVGTSTVRALESAANNRRVETKKGQSKLFIFPGYKFKIVDVLITNFHLPRSTLLLLVSAFAGKDLILKAYHEAIKEHYRFYSFGDAMLIL